MTQTDTTGQLSWLLDNLVNQVEHVQQALILSRDGLMVAASQGLTPEDGEHLSALAAGSRAWPGEPAGSSAAARYGRPSSRWSSPSCSSSRLAGGRA
jgi:Roadblock/LC7 domain